MKPKTPTTVIYHSADFDGIFCREIARRFLPGAILIGWTHGDVQLRVLDEGPVYILDLSPECLADYHGVRDRIIWIDHHISAMTKYPSDIPGYRIDGVAACRLAWQWFSIHEHNAQNWKNEMMTLPVPPKVPFVSRTVVEPLAVRLAGEYDVWDKRDPDAETFQFGLRFVSQGADFWEALLRTDEVGAKAAVDLLEHGRIAQRYQQMVDAEVIRARSFMLRFEGLRFLALNTAKCNSQTFAALDTPASGHDALMAFYWQGERWIVSMYHAKRRTGIDLSKIAEKHGGGGHKGACGFQPKDVKDIIAFLRAHEWNE